MKQKYYVLDWGGSNRKGEKWWVQVVYWCFHKQDSLDDEIKTALRKMKN